jgi:hypothetical protein
MNRFKTWYATHQDAITWFLIGWLASAGLSELARENYTWAAVLFVIAYANYLMRQWRTK